MKKIKTSKIIGKVLWWSSRDQNGIIKDPSGNEYYFDRSVISLRASNNLMAGSLVLFSPSRADKVLTAKNVALTQKRCLDQYNESFNIQKAQQVLPIF